LFDALQGAPTAARAVASNVAGDGVRRDIEASCARAGLSVSFAASAREQLGVVNGYADPSQLGVDRWVAMVAAHRLLEGHKLVVNAGTALTIDALTGEGRFLGGLIVPGPTLMRRALDHGTAGLRLTEGRFAALPASTPDAITSGAIQACVGAIERLAGEMAAHGTPPGRIILSGGAAGEIAGAIAAPLTIVETLVLDGLVRIARNA
jgi:type III pantothenate kinase